MDERTWKERDSCGEIVKERWLSRGARKLADDVQPLQESAEVALVRFEVCVPRR